MMIRTFVFTDIGSMLERCKLRLFLLSLKTRKILTMLSPLPDEYVTTMLAEQPSE